MITPDVKRDSGQVLIYIPRYHKMLSTDVEKAVFSKRIKLCSKCPARNREQCTEKNTGCINIARNINNECPRHLWPKVKTATVDKPSEPKQIETGRKINNLAVVACHFNPCGYKLPIRNAHEFLDKIGVPVTVVELSFDGRFEFDSQHKIVGDLTKNFMWQKERLLNVGIQNLPADVDAVAWIDMDAVFQNPNWYEDAKQLLEEYPIVQLYERVDYLGPDGREIIKQNNSWAYNWNNDLNGKVYGAPGFAWAARREAIPWGVYDKDIVGGGDCHAIAAFVKERKWVEKQYSSLRRPAADFDAWKAKQLPLINGRIGCVSGGAYHLYHGTHEKRQYGDRLQILRNHNFCISDIQIGENGVWEWASYKPGLHQDIRDYFLNREEDA